MGKYSNSKQKHAYCEHRNLIDQNNGSDSDSETQSSSDYDLINYNIKNSNFKNRSIKHSKLKKMTKFSIFCIMICSFIYFIIYIPIFYSWNSRKMPLIDWGYNKSRDINDYVLPNNFTELIEPQNVCTNNFFLLIVVCSSVDNFEARQTIRDTWGNIKEFNYNLFKEMHSHMIGRYLNINEINVQMNMDYLNLQNISEESINISSHNIPIKIIFLIGKNNNLQNESSRLKYESETYGDLLQENFIDSYNNLTLKSVMMLKWITYKCANRMKFIMKCDDDTFVNIPNLLHVLMGGTVPVYNDTVEMYDSRTINALLSRNRLPTNGNLLTGYLFCGVKPVADIKSKWYAPVYMFEGETYPKYLSGSSYLMSADVIPKLFYASLNTSILHLEDVYLTGVCAEKIHLRRRHNPLFLFNSSKKFCSYKGIITQHYLKGDLMATAYDFVRNTTIKCQMPDNFFKVNRLSRRFKHCS